jgi:hypothetical protein
MRTGQLLSNKIGCCTIRGFKPRQGFPQMNLDRIRQLVRKGDCSREALDYLVSCRGECEWLDYKESLDLETEHSAAGFARDVLAIRNSGGGYLVLGVEDKTWRIVGLRQPLPFDTKALRDKLNKIAGAQVEIDIVQHKVWRSETSLIVGLILVRAGKNFQKNRRPVLVGKDFRPHTSFGLRRGEIYTRSGDSTIKVTTEDALNNLLDDLDQLAESAAIERSRPVSPFAIEAGTFRLLPKSYDLFVGKDQARKEIEAAVLGDPRIWIVNVHGPGGVGKSALATWCAYHFFENNTFEAILQLSAKNVVLTDDGIRPTPQSLTSLEDLLDQIAALFEEQSKTTLEEKKSFAVEFLNSFSTLLILDNMETVNDGRVLSFVQSLPPQTRAKVLLTSRLRTDRWEQPVPVQELSEEEVRQLAQALSDAWSLSLDLDRKIVERLRMASGGLPLAIKWILGQVRLSGDLSRALRGSEGRDSPVLEFSFRDTWNLLRQESRLVLAAMSIFDGPATVNELVIATALPEDTVEAGLDELSKVTLVNKNTSSTSANYSYTALPITLNFSGARLKEMDSFGPSCRERIREYRNIIESREEEARGYNNTVQAYGLSTQQERKAAALVRRAESEVFAGRLESAKAIFHEARALAPTSAYVLAMFSSFELNRGQKRAAEDLIVDACNRANSSVAALCYTIKARVMQALGRPTERLAALETAIKHSPADVVLRHQYGVALSQARREVEAVKVFTEIISSELQLTPPSPTLLMALTTRIINLRRLRRLSEADDDIRLGLNLAQRYPHLSGTAERIRRFASESSTTRL